MALPEKKQSASTCGETEVESEDFTGKWGPQCPRKASSSPSDAGQKNTVAQSGLNIAWNPIPTVLIITWYSTFWSLHMWGRKQSPLFHSIVNWVSFPWVPVRQVNSKIILPYVHQGSCDRSRQAQECAKPHCDHPKVWLALWLGKVVAEVLAVAAKHFQIF